jgi:hypothetical protein
VEECGPCPVFASFTLAFALQLRIKHGKTVVRLRKTSVRLRKTSVRAEKPRSKENPQSVRKAFTVRKPSVRVRKTSVRVKKTLSKSSEFCVPGFTLGTLLRSIYDINVVIRRLYNFGITCVVAILRSSSYYFLKITITFETYSCTQYHID